MVITLMRIRGVKVETGLLLEYTVRMLELLILQYEEGIITKEVFEAHTRVKTEFLSSNVNIIESRYKRAKAKQLMDKCKKVIGIDLCI